MFSLLSDGTSPIIEQMTKTDILDCMGNGRIPRLQLIKRQRRLPITYLVPLSTLKLSWANSSHDLHHPLLNPSSLTIYSITITRSRGMFPTTHLLHPSASLLISPFNSSASQSNCIYSPISSIICCRRFHGAKPTHNIPRTSSPSFPHHLTSRKLLEVDQTK